MPVGVVVMRGGTASFGICGHCRDPGLDDRSTPEEALGIVGLMNAILFALLRVVH
jgi:hypothetical protein